jgi:hypothetical protein
MYADDFGADYHCDFYRIGLLYDGWSLNQGSNYTTDADLSAATGLMYATWYFCNPDTFICS